MRETDFWLCMASFFARRTRGGGKGRCGLMSGARSAQGKRHSLFKKKVPVSSGSQKGGTTLGERGSPSGKKGALNLAQRGRKRKVLCSTFVGGGKRRFERKRDHELALISFHSLIRGPPAVEYEGGCMIGD